MSRYTRQTTTKAYKTVAGDDHLLVKLEEISWISNSLIEQIEDDMEIDAYIKGHEKINNMVFIKHEDITENR
jgi:hypothetical protein